MSNHVNSTLIKRILNPKLSILTQSRLLNESISDTEETILIYRNKLGIYPHEDDIINETITFCENSLEFLKQERIKMNERMKIPKSS